MTEAFDMCTKCLERRNARTTLFEILLAFHDRAANSRQDCCGQHTELRIVHHYGLGAGDWEYRVLDALLPDPYPLPWETARSKVSFFPFLVVMEPLRSKRPQRNDWEQCPRGCPDFC